MRTLITGVSGFVGRSLSRQLVAAGSSVVGTFLSDEPDVEGVEVHRVDLRDPDAVSEVVKLARPDAIAHLAGLGHVGESWQRTEEYQQVNIGGTDNVLRAASGIRVVIASSAEVYGNVPVDEQPISEDRPPAPANPYASTKAAAETLGLREGAIVARSFNLAGPGQSTRFSLPGFAEQLAAIHRGARPPVLSVGNLAARRDFLHVDDGAAAYRVLIDRGKPGAVYNLGSGLASTIQEALERLIAVAGVEVELEVDPERYRPVDAKLLQADTSRLRALGWAPRRTLDDIVRDLWESALSRMPESEKSAPRR